MSTTNLTPNEACRQVIAHLSDVFVKHKLPALELELVNTIQYTTLAQYEKYHLAAMHYQGPDFINRTLFDSLTIRIKKDDFIQVEITIYFTQKNVCITHYGNKGRAIHDYSHDYDDKICQNCEKCIQPILEEMAKISPAT